jgi:hypothetical protein
MRFTYTFDFVKLFISNKGFQSTHEFQYVHKIKTPREGIVNL